MEAQVVEQRPAPEATYHPSTTKDAEGESEAPEQESSDHRPQLPPWKWHGSLFAILLTCLIHGYDVSNVANIQPHLYEAFGDIELLPWIALSYTLSVFAVLSLSRKVTYCFDLRSIYIASIVVFLAGAAVGGSASSMSAVIVGRVIMGVGGAVVYQTNLTFISVFASQAQNQRLIGALSGAWAVGLIVGGPIGAALAENADTTWRWAFYLNLPWMGLALLIAIFCFPPTYLGPSIPLSSRILQVDPLGIAFNMATPVLFSIALVFSGPVWAWNSGPSITIWVLFGVTLCAWILQQYLCILTTPTQRAIPVHLFPRLDLIPLWIASGCAAVAYAIPLYYIPLFFAFARGHDAIQQTVRTLPFILTFIATVVIVAGVLPLVGRWYNLFYVFAGTLTTSGAAALAATLRASTSDSHILAFEALIGIGLGFSFQHGIGISNTLNQSVKDRVDSATLLLLAQMGAIAISLSMGGCIYSNIGEARLSSALEGVGLSSEEIRQALAGASSLLRERLVNQEGVFERAVEAVAGVLALEFWLVVAAGGACVLCGVVMGLVRVRDRGVKGEDGA
ncbi:major facilitator superfamily domain-containing protein [Aspergillus keveii]|uniref:Major facilitator superfamily domain-containing protein n=1 Tax=Aspergillus keveii TaxID=714993 RepID=A0ABR4FT61_9EURO